MIEFEVKDTGIGIPQDRQEAIFASFDQADNSYSRAYDGMGLGLAIANGYARMMNGTLSVHSEVGQGSVFCLCLPA
jgi:signal transduction histidine kinase